MPRKQVGFAIVLIIFLLSCSCSSQNELPAPMPTPTMVPSATPTPTPTMIPSPPPVRWEKGIVLGANNITLLIADADNKNLYALEQIAEKTILVWGSNDQGVTWTKIGTVPPELYRTRQVFPAGMQETGEKLFVWPTLPGNLSLDTHQPFAVLEMGKTIFLFIVKGNEVRRATLNLP